MESGTERHRPVAVTRAVLLLWVSFAAGLVKTLLDLNHVSAPVGPAVNYFALAVTFALIAFLITQISAGRNWARITFLVMFLIGMMPTLTLIAGEFAQSMAAGSVTVVQLILQIQALIMLFTRPGSEWFKPVNS